MNQSESYALTLRMIRASRGWTQADFAEKMGASESTVYEIEKGRRDPDPWLRRGAEVAGYTLTDLDILAGMVATSARRVE